VEMSQRAECNNRSFRSCCRHFEMVIVSLLNGLFVNTFGRFYFIYLFTNVNVLSLCFLLRKTPTSLINRLCYLDTHKSTLYLNIEYKWVWTSYPRSKKKNSSREKNKYKSSKPYKYTILMLDFSEIDIS